MNEFSIVMNEHSESGDINSDFEKVINDLSNFNEKIELVTELQQNCSWVHQKYLKTTLERNHFCDAWWKSIATWQTRHPTFT